MRTEVQSKVNIKRFPKCPVLIYVTKPQRPTPTQSRTDVPFYAHGA